MQIELLADNLDAIASVAKWYVHEWQDDQSQASVERACASILTFTNRHRPPLLILAKEKEEVIGAAELKFREMEIFPDFEHWIGGVYVEQSHRGQGIGRALVCDLVQRAEKAGISRLYLQTVDLTGGLYSDIGFRPVKETDHRDRRVLVMRLEMTLS